MKCTCCNAILHIDMTSSRMKKVCRGAGEMVTSVGGLNNTPSLLIQAMQKNYACEKCA